MSAGRAFLSIFFALLPLTAGVAAAQAPAPPTPVPPGAVPVVKDVVVQGNRRVQEAVILGRVSAKAGAPFQPSRLAEDVRAIFALGFFDDVQLKVETSRAA